MKSIIKQLTARGYWLRLLRHEPCEKYRSTDNDLVNVPQYKRCKHCSHNLGEVK